MMNNVDDNDVANRNSEIHDVMFDFCGVLVELNYRPCLQGHFPQKFVDTLCADEDDIYGFFAAEARMDAGDDFADVIKDYHQQYGEDLAKAFTYYIEHYDDALPKMIDGMEALLTDLRKAGYGVWGLTNWSHETFHLAFEKFPQLERLLQDTVVSGVEKMHKPNADIFNLALNRFGLNPVQTVFFDDTQANVDGAKAVGIQGVHFNDASNARKELQRLGVKI
ncbi:HAD family phosphatase [Bifidobacterium sp. ESL0690]|uniref:HAD family hydrolase n=1 Tax=Bifidobacterium sp. ESL0690 TaxID=2983214 RepID=UPI0023F96C31|nr:HAD family phosphatase [Bifidobacterium sp. ESL0690]WEV47582.1 HAD family phosphatase [Bifidobacterium sp. ESL0690]